MAANKLQAIELYHFTEEKNINSILKSGLLTGYIPYEMPNGMTIGKHKGYIWLTTNSVFDEQTWARKEFLGRDLYRLKIKIPGSQRKNLINWTDNCKRLTNMHEELNDGCDFNNWFLFTGRILPKQILETIRRG